MKIQNILNEDFGTPAVPQRRLSFKDLNSLQVGILTRMADGRLDVDTAKESEYDIMTDLVDLGLLTSEYELSPAGQKAVAIAKKVGGSAELLDARRKQAAKAAFDDKLAVKADDLDPPALDTMGIDDTSVPDPIDDEEEDEFQFDLGRKEF